MRGWLLGLFWGVALAAPACESDHSALARRSNAAGGVAGEARGGSGGAQAGFTMVAQSGGSRNRNTGGRPPDESPGDNVLTLVHGIVDADRVLVCLVAGTGAGARVLDLAPVVLDYGQSLVLTDIPGVDLTTEGLEPVVIAGQLDLVSELGCADALEVARREQDSAPTAIGDSGGSAGAGGFDSGGASAAAGGAGSDGGFGGAGGEAGAGTALPEPPKLRVGELPILPAGTVASGRSYLFVSTGCIGGQAFAGTGVQSACGAEYSPATPTLGAVLVALSRRTAYGSLGLQVVHASAATGTVNVVASRLLSDGSQGLASALEFGALVPRVVQPAAPAHEYGVDSLLWQVEVLSDFTPLFAEPWSTIQQRAGLDALVDGRSYTLILIGPSAGLALKGFWNPPALSVVRNDPTRPDG